MMSFEEAVAAVMLRQVREDEECPDMDERAARYRDMHSQIQNSFEAYMISIQLMEVGIETKWPLQKLICVAFSHGVMIGVEMEKQEGAPQGMPALPKRGFIRRLLMRRFGRK
jgi:hypothetical protein